MDLFGAGMDDDMFGAEMMIMLVMSTGRGTPEMAQRYIAEGGDPNNDFGDGLRMLHLAAQFDQPDIARVLLAAKADTEVRSACGETPLDQAAWKGSFNVAQELLRAHADVNCQTNSGYSPLHRVAFYNHPRLAGLFMLAGADVTLRDENNQTAYEVAVERQNRRIAVMLTPMLNDAGEDISGAPYARNNPTHPQFKPSARESLFALHTMEGALHARNEVPAAVAANTDEAARNDAGGAAGGAAGGGVDGDSDADADGDNAADSGATEAATGTQNDE